MRENSFFKYLNTLIPLVFSGLLCIALVFILWQKTNTDQLFIDTLSNIITIFISISGFLAAFIMVYLASSALGLKKNRVQVVDNLSQITQKMHNFREIVNLLLQSKIWLPGLKEYIDNDFEALLKESFKTENSEGNIVTGVLRKIDNNYAVVDVIEEHLKSEF